MDITHDFTFEQIPDQYFAATDMKQHLSFWIGFFAAALMIIPIAVGVWGAAGDLAEYIAVFLFGGIIGLVIILVAALFFRQRILKATLGRAETTLHDVVDGMIKTAVAVSDGDKDKIQQEALSLGQVAVGWYSWTSFYRWVVGSALGLLLAFGAFTGTVLLFEQNRKLGAQTETLEAQTLVLGDQTKLMGEQTQRLKEQTAFMAAQTDLMKAQTDRLNEQTLQAQIQNEIMTVSLVGELRQQLLIAMNENLTFAELDSDNDFNDTLDIFGSTDGTCKASFVPDLALTALPGNGTLSAMSKLATSGRLADQVRQAFEYLVNDNNHGVALSSMIILDATGHDYSFERKYFENLFIDGATLTGKYNFSFTGSIVARLNCEDCNVDHYGGLITDDLLTPAKGAAYDLIVSIDEDVFTGFGQDLFNRNTMVFPLKEHTVDTEPYRYNVLMLSSLGEQAGLFYAPDDQTDCEALEQFTLENPLLIYHSTALE